jgi:hypothetical protein
MRSTPVACIAALAAIALPAQTASAHHPGDDHAPRSGKIAPQTRELLGQVRKATRRYRDVAVAKAASYEAAKTCVEDPKYGGMGIHYANPKLLADGVLDPTRPEVLVYQPARDGRLSLGAVEYFLPDADQDLDTNEDLPSLFGLPFDGPMLGHEPGMPKHYDLHVWLYKHNPAGLFAAWNPTVRCP